MSMFSQDAGEIADAMGLTEEQIMGVVNLLADKVNEHLMPNADGNAMVYITDDMKVKVAILTVPKYLHSAAEECFAHVKDTIGDDAFTEILHRAFNPTTRCKDNVTASFITSMYNLIENGSGIEAHEEKSRQFAHSVLINIGYRNSITSTILYTGALH